MELNQILQTVSERVEAKAVFTRLLRLAIRKEYVEACSDRRVSIKTLRSVENSLYWSHFKGFNKEEIARFKALAHEIQLEIIQANETRRELRPTATNIDTSPDFPSQFVHAT